MHLRDTWPGALAAAAVFGLARAGIVVAEHGYLEAHAWDLAWRRAAAPFLLAFVVTLPVAALLAEFWRRLAARSPRLAVTVPVAMVPLGLLVALDVARPLDEVLGRSAYLGSVVAACVAATVLSPSLPRRAALVGSVVGVAVALGAALRFVPLVERASWPERPNVILISVDTQRADHLSCYGYERPTSPEIDRFAERAVRFTRAFTPYPWTLLAHMSLFTSLDPSAHGVRSDRALAPGIPTLAEHLRDAGYRTAAVLDDVVWLEAKYEFDRGFDVYLPIGGTAKEKQARISPLLDDLGDEPFFLFLHFFDVHSDSTALPYDSLDEFQRLFAGEYDGDFSGCSPEGVCASKYLKELEARGVVLEGADLEYLVALYDAGVRTFDRQAGVLFDELEERGLFETSITVVTADHGEAFFEHGVPLHSGVHDEVVRVPLLVRTPDRRQGAVVDDLVSLIDVAPTLLELCDIEPRGMQGQSFRDLLDGERSAPRRDWVLLDDGEDRIQGVRTASWKLMRANGRNWRLYDLERDPGEAQNVLARPGDPPPVFEELKRILEAEMEKLAAFRRTFAEQASVSRGDDRARLEALGYVDEASR